jgi:hypothetical protein
MLDGQPDSAAEDALRRFVRQCQIAAASYLPHTNAADVLDAVWSALRAFPVTVSEESLPVGALILLDLARHTILWCETASSVHSTMGSPLSAEALRVLSATCTDTRASLTRLAAMLHVSQWRLCRTIRSDTGVGFVTHLSGLRVITAVWLLGSSDLAVI